MFEIEIMNKQKLQIPRRGAGSPIHKMRNLDIDTSPPSPTARNDFSQQPKTISEIQRSLQFIRQWIRETEPILSNLQSKNDDAPELISMLANRFRENLKEEMLDKIASSISELDNDVNSRIFKKSEDLRKEVNRLSDNLYSIFKDMDQDIGGIKAQIASEKQHLLSYQRDQIQEMNRLADATNGVKIMCEDALSGLNEKFDKRLEGALNVVRDLKELFTKRYDFLSLETTNAINSLTEMIQNNLNVQSLKLEKIYAELKENIHNSHNNMLENQQVLKGMIDQLNIKIKELRDHTSEIFDAFSQNSDKKMEEIQNSSNQLKKTQNDIIKRIDKEAKLSLNIQQHQEKQNLLFEEKIDNILQQLEVLNNNNNNSYFEERILNIEKKMDNIQIDLGQKNQQVLNKLQKFEENMISIELKIEENIKAIELKFEENMKTIEIRNAVDELVQLTSSNEHNENLDQFMLESTNLLDILSSTMSKDVNELIVGNVLDSIFQIAYEKISEIELNKILNTKNESEPSVNPSWIKFVNDKLEYLESQFVLSEIEPKSARSTVEQEIESLMEKQDDLIEKMKNLA